MQVYSYVNNLSLSSCHVTCHVTWTVPKQKDAGWNMSWQIKVFFFNNAIDDRHRKKLLRDSLPP